MGKYNDLDQKNWKYYLQQKKLTTNSLWVSTGDNFPKNYPIFKVPKRKQLQDCMGKNFHGLFIPQIPYQFILRFSKQNQTIYDCFGGSGTTHKVATLLNRNCISNDISPKEDFIQQGDSRYFNPGQNVQMIFMHPPYHNIVKYSEQQGDGSNFSSVSQFLYWFEQLAGNVTKYLDKERYLILVCGNIYSGGEQHTLGVWCKDIIRKYGFICKSHIIKDYGQTKGGDAKSYNLNYYRQLKNGYNKFYGDNIFIMKKVL